MEKLIYVDDSLPGITRRGAGRGFAYYSPEGELIRCRKERARLNGIALPPAYRDAWFCPMNNGHILATGFDERERKQYRYHPEFRLMRESEKFDRCLEFGKMLPKIRKRVEADIDGDNATRSRVLAAVVRLLDMGFVRIGNEIYKKSNNSFGASTLRDQHATIHGSTVELCYVGKGGKERHITLEDEALARAVEDARDVPGDHLFQYYDEDGQRQPIGSGDVNEYLREVMGDEFSAKNFRTWHASVLAFSVIARARTRPTISSMLEEVSDKLGNTPVVARNSYIHPAVIDILSRDSGWEVWRENLRMPRATRYLTRHERGLIQLLEESPEAAELLAA
ncbi:DNA topoisomerase IB [Erythrobacter sp. THAF29]|uniref:DNA topoisomerase IB n=1 Tax=Erythrobacter sp. THAF29 TaxID=2587851 RepID=UPI0012696FED|nr:DNA topoisomerase IB [Erythrobacter sp. THAF29]QFT78315.1 Eukaryotic DNA topoisomerase I, catalytic core [Erythrobacter sp. THAF29]